MQKYAECPTSLSGGNSELEPPDPISNSEVKRFSADGSVGSPHVRVGHGQALKYEYLIRNGRVFFSSEMRLKIISFYRLSKTAAVYTVS